LVRVFLCGLELSEFLEDIGEEEQCIGKGDEDAKNLSGQ